MSIPKYISTKDAVRLTGLSTQEIYALIHNGTLPARKAPKSGWRIPYQALIDLGVIREDVPHVIETPKAEERISFVADEEHYSIVFKKMTEVKHILRISTANLKNFSVYVESKGKKQQLRLCEFFLSLVERGVHVQVICMKPFGFYNYTMEKCPQLLDNPLFELRHKDHCHMKIFIFDDECVYLGSANITKAAIGKHANNNEAGMLLCGDDLIEAPLNHFDKVWNDPSTLKHTWKRFISLAKEAKRNYDRKIDEE